MKLRQYLKTIPYRKNPFAYYHFYYQILLYAMNELVLFCSYIIKIVISFIQWSELCSNKLMFVFSLHATELYNIYRQIENVFLEKTLTCSSLVNFSHETLLWIYDIIMETKTCNRDRNRDRWENNNRDLIETVNICNSSSLHPGPLKTEQSGPDRDWD